MITKLSDFLARMAKPWLILVSFLVMGAMMGYFLPGAQARLEASGGGPIDLLMFPAPAAVLAGIAAFTEEGRAFYLLVELSYDLVYPIAYTLFYGLTLTVLLNQIAAPGSFARRLNLLPVAAFVFDLLENAGIISLLVSFPKQSAALAGFVSVVNSAKWVFALGSIVVLFGALVLWGVKKVFGKK
ncbi:MAG: hypothetical protein CVU44_22395 [Chloroflexi bacterium HGW-Chloroflexi-6]|nr:MAG: hypothetical protein CVU44_22395 [Chloroflexi bacterium HGW-Chloroflexi-6]